MKTAFLIAAPTSGSGKTTIARGLMALFTEKGYTVQPFKCGPDYIDTKFHEAVCGRPSVNLDTFMATPEHVRKLFCRYGDHADICIVEGMMGLFDGYDRDRGSSAEIARTLNIPVILVVDAKSAAYSMAPLLKGFMQFDPQVRCCGVIFNKVGSERHYAMLQQVCRDVGIDCLGYLPKSQALETDSRYLGLDFSADSDNRELLRQIEQHIDWKKLVTAGPKFGDGKPSVCYCQTDGLVTENSPFGYGKPQDLKNVLIARNQESFSFLYTEIIDSFRHPQFFDPETAVPDLTHTDLLYLPGGYPEKHLEALVGNKACREAIRDYALRGGRIVAECGGMMYLCEKIVTDEGEYPMCGVLPYSITARKADRKLSLGYRRFTMGNKEYRGHEFHYTQFSETPESITQVYNAKGEPVPTPVFKFKNVFASYTHLYHL
ncbi:cobyrinate a,c-diamide synthase [Prevotella sp. E13-17]|uniref:cobyrinate a,c-diamide synthase n=1 Tax=Prevotella sp. E13-17 TaxID=2913616 RepID=UPI001ED9E9DB|nr:cobyrinate a,c-diamide synthase [Prevotella sp. E13-17]UKK51706.1 cobyrinate a,c-diamide synthase [Prevotella sp. E13-17]